MTNEKKSLVEGISLVELRQISDKRGALLHMLRSDAPEFSKFGECYFSEVLPGAVKAWKFHHRQVQNIAVPVGRIRMVIYDDRDGSSTRGQVEVLELGRPDKYFRLQIPPQLWYGFSCISKVPALLVNCSDLLHDPLESQTREFDDRSIPYSWVEPCEGISPN